MRFPCYIQHDSRDCGPTCLRMIAKYYGKDFPLHYLKEKCFQRKSGTSMLDLSSAAENIGFRTHGVKVTFEQLSIDVTLPCIISWNQNHFIVVYRISGRRVTVGDPAQGILKYHIDDFLKGWISVSDPIRGEMGIALTFEPTALFTNADSIPKGKIDRIGFARLVGYVRPYLKYVTFIVITLILGSAASLVFPALTQSVVDIGIENSDLRFIAMVLAAQLVLILGQATNEIVKNWIMLNVSVRVNLSLVSDFLGKLMRLPISFFDSKRVGDLMQRIGDFTRIQEFLTEILISIIMAGIAIIVYGIIMAGYSLPILSVFIGGSIVYIAWISIFLKRRKKLDYMRFQQAASSNSNVIQLITGMQEIKLNNSERKKQWEWEQIQARLYDISIKSLSLSQAQQIGGLLIDQSKNVIISFIAAYSVVNGNMTLGMMIALQYIVGQMNAPVSQFVSFMESIQDTRISLERLNEIQQIQDEESAKDNRIMNIPDYADICFKNVSFQYGGPRSAKVLKDINISIRSGQTTAIVGVSGSGKTTLLKLLLGFYQPSGGDILLGDQPLKNYSDRAWRSRCGAVMQDGFIFSDTIASNIAASDDEIDMDKVRNAARLANLDDFISNLPMGYNTQIGMEGNGLSNGQKQRILIARAIYKDAPYILFDEATNSLDANNERTIMENLSSFLEGRTAVIVAHRLSTVRNADNIVVLDKGMIVEQGAHTELVNRKAEYYSLIKNQLELGL